VRGPLRLRQAGIRHVLHHEQEGRDELQDQEQRDGVQRDGGNLWELLRRLPRARHRSDLPRGLSTTAR
jgi:hypothetical protein